PDTSRALTFLFLSYREFHPAVFSSALLRIIGGGWLFLARSAGCNAIIGNTAADQHLLYRIGAIERKFLVDLRCSRIVSISGQLHMGVGISVQDLRQVSNRISRIGRKLSGAGFEVHVFEVERLRRVLVLIGEESREVVVS